MNQIQQDSIANLFHHRALLYESIRFIRLQQDLTADSQIQGKIVHGTVKDRFICLSYTWGEDKSERAIRLNGQLFYVRENLWDFLSVARIHFADQSIWIDAVSIDQRNTSERNDQVQKIGEIFQNASKVLIWLGRGFSNSSEIREYVGLNETSSGFQRDHWKWFHEPPPAEKVKHLSASYWDRKWQARFLAQINEIFEHPYWGRLWIVQELCLASNIQLIFENLVVKEYCLWSLLKEFMTFQQRGPPQLVAADAEQEHEQSPNMPQAVVPEANNFRYAISILTRRGGHILDFGTFGIEVNEASYRLKRVQRNSLDISTILSAYRTSKCTDPQDRIYAVLSLMRNGQSFQVDYTATVEQLFYRALTLLKVETIDISQYSNVIIDLMEGLGTTPQRLGAVSFSTSSPPVSVRVSKIRPKAAALDHSRFEDLPCETPTPYILKCGRCTARLQVHDLLTYTGGLDADTIRGYCFCTASTRCGKQNAMILFSSHAEHSTTLLKVHEGGSSSSRPYMSQNMVATTITAAAVCNTSIVESVHIGAREMMNLHAQHVQNPRAHNVKLQMNLTTYLFLIDEAS